MSLEIRNAVIHVLDREAEEPLLNEFELDINDDLYNFLEKHMSKCLNDDDARKGRFKDGRNIIREVCTRMAQDNTYFLEGSKEIARQLFRAMKTNSSISSTDLVICLYNQEDMDYIAVLKMDYTISFIHEIEMVEDKFKISIKKQDISLPGVGQKIQKAAFVTGYEGVFDYDLTLVDNQINAKNAEEPVAQFFLQTFLDAELIMDNKACTKLFKTESENWIREKAKEGETVVEEVRDFVNFVIRQEDQIDLNEFTERAFEDKPYLREDFISTMKDKGLMNETFEIDKDWVERKLAKIRLKTDSNIEITLDYEDFNDRGKFEIISNHDGTRSIIIKNIVTLQEK